MIPKHIEIRRIKKIIVLNLIVFLYSNFKKRSTKKYQMSNAPKLLQEVIGFHVGNVIKLKFTKLNLQLHDYKFKLFAFYY